MQEIVGAEWLRFVGQAVLFLNGEFDLRRILPDVKRLLRSTHLPVRLAAYQCVRQYEASSPTHPAIHFAKAGRSYIRCVQAEPRFMSETPEAYAELWAAYDLESDIEAQQAGASLLRLISETCGVLDAASWIPACKQLATMTARSLHKVICIGFCAHIWDN